MQSDFNWLVWLFANIVQELYPYFAISGQIKDQLEKEVKTPVFLWEVENRVKY